jgi:hypothetical protein
MWRMDLTGSAEGPVMVVVNMVIVMNPWLPQK